MAGYKKCPRCDLNWIKNEDELCDVCKAELKIGGVKLIEDDEDIEELKVRICPNCNINILEDDEILCSVCREEKENKSNSNIFDEENDNDDSWRYDKEEIENSDDNDNNEILLGSLEEDELEHEEEMLEEEVYDDCELSYNYDD